jgi:flagellar biosynthesis protein FlhA
LAGLLREQIPIRDLVTILAAAADAARSTKEPALIVEAVRHALARVISQRHRGADGSIHAVAVGPATDAKLAEAVVVGSGRIGLELGPTESRALLEAIAAAVKTLTEAGHPPLLLSRTRTRAALRGLVERQFPQLAVVAYEELVPSVPVVVHAQVEI